MLHLHASVVTIIIVISLLGSLLVLLMIIKFKKLRHRNAMVSLSVIAADTVLVLSYHLPVLVSSFKADWIFMFVGCQIFGFLSTNFVVIRWFNMGLLALDRFCIVRFPFSYPKIERKVLIFLTIISWMVPSLLSLGTVTGFASVAFRENVPTCLIYSPGVKRGTVFYSFVLIFSFIIGGVVPMVLYTWLFWQARKLRTATVNVGTVMINNSRQSILSSQDGQAHNSSNTYKPVVTFAIIFVTFFLTSVPTASFQILRTLSMETWCKIPPLLHFITVEIFLSSTALDPFLVMRDRDFRKRIRHVLLHPNRCGQYCSNNVMLPPAEDNLRSASMRNVSLPNLFSERLYEQSADSIDTGSFRQRSGSAPAQYLTNHIKNNPMINALKETIKEVEDIEEDTDSISDSSSRDSDCKSNGGETLKPQVLYIYNEDMECIEVRVAFED